MYLNSFSAVTPTVAQTTDSLPTVEGTSVRRPSARDGRQADRQTLLRLSAQSRCPNTALKHNENLPGEKESFACSATVGVNKLPLVRSARVRLEEMRRSGPISSQRHRAQHLQPADNEAAGFVCHPPPPPPPPPAATPCATKGQLGDRYELVRRTTKHNQGQGHNATAAGYPVPATQWSSLKNSHFLQLIEKFTRTTCSIN